MRQDHQQQIGIVQRQVLSQSARQLVQLVTATPAEFADLVERQVAENPFLSVSHAFALTVGPQTEGASGQTGLFTHVLAEIPMLVRKPADQQIAERLAEGLDERGYLVDSLSEVAADLKVPVGRVEKVLQALQGIEPPGLFARSLAECLALQLRAQGQLDTAAVLLLSNLDGLATHGVETFARLHDLDAARVRDLTKTIARLPRNPALAFGDIAPLAIPELQFSREAGEWSVRPLVESTPKLTLRQTAFAAALSAATDTKTQSEMRRRWREACALHQAAGLRETTLLAMGKHLLVQQRNGLESGFARLEPLTQRSMAATLSLHESSVSRMVRNRFALVEGQIVPLSRFFERPMAGKGGAALTRSIVLDALRGLLAADPATQGMSDNALTQKLAGCGIEISRRRLAKYRELLGIASSRRRRGAVVV